MFGVHINQARYSFPANTLLMCWGLGGGLTAKKNAGDGSVRNGPRRLMFMEKRQKDVSFPEVLSKAPSSHLQGPCTDLSSCPCKQLSGFCCYPRISITSPPSVLGDLGFLRGAGTCVCKSNSSCPLLRTSQQPEVAKLFPCCNVSPLPVLHLCHMVDFNDSVPLWGRESCP